jgi:hypothetical protein
VPSAQALEEVFGLVAGLDDSAITVLEGLVDAQQMADERPTVVVVVASSADTTSPAVAAQLEALMGGSGSHLQLPNAVHEVRPAEWSSHQNGQHHTCQVVVLLGWLLIRSPLMHTATKKGSKDWNSACRSQPLSLALTLLPQTRCREAATQCLQACGARPST